MDKLYLARYNYDKDGYIPRIYPSEEAFQKAKDEYVARLRAENPEIEDKELVDRAYEAFGSSWENPRKGKEVYQNRLVELFIASISNPLQYSETRQPLDAVTDYLKDKVLGSIDELQTREKAKMPQLYYATPAFQNITKADLISGKQNLGAMALGNSHHMLAQAVGLTQKTIKEHSYLGINNLSGIYSEMPNYSDKDAKIFTLISDWLSAMINAHVDVAKDPYINRLNVRKYTLNMTNLLLRAGKGESTFYFLAQPILKQAANLYEEFSGSYGVDFTGKSPSGSVKDSVREGYTKAIIDLKQGGLTTEDAVKEHVTGIVKGLAKSGPFNVGTLRKFMTAPTKDASKENYAQYYLQQLAILEVFNQLEPYARALSELTNISQIDTKKFGNNYALQQSFLIKMDRFFEENKSMKGEAIKILKDTFLKDKILYGLIRPRKYLGGLLLRTTETFETRRKQIYKILGKTGYGLSDSFVNNITRMMEAEYKSKFWYDYIKRENIDLQGLFYGNNSIPKRLFRLKQYIYNHPELGLLNSDGTFTNPLLNSLRTMIKDEDSRTLPDFLEFTESKTKDVNFSNHVIRAWEELFDMTTEDPELEGAVKALHNFARDLAVYSFFTSGDAFGANNLFKFVPNSFRESSGYYDYIRNLEESPEELANIRISEVLKNLWWDDEVISPLSVIQEGWDTETMQRTHSLNTNKIDVITSSGASVKRGISTIYIPTVFAIKSNIKSIGTNTAGQEVYPLYVKIDFGKKNDPNTTMVYQFCGTKAYTTYSSNGIITNYSRPVYKLTNKKGIKRHGMFLSELNDKQPSLIGINNTGAALPQGITEYKGTTPLVDVTDLSSETTNMEQRLNGTYVSKDKTEPITSNSPIREYNGNWSRQEVEEDPTGLYIFTDNTDRTSGSNAINEDTRYAKKYGKGKFFPTTTQAVIRGLDNAMPISTQRWYHDDKKGNKGRWTDDAIDEFKTTIDAEIEDIKAEWDTGKYDHLVVSNFDGFFNTKISNISKDRVPQIYDYLHGKIDELYKYVDSTYTNISDEQSNETISSPITVVNGYELTEDEKQAIDKLKQELNNNNQTNTGHTFKFKDGMEVATDFELNTQQQEALHALEDFYNSGETCISISGYAGTGKTTIMKVFDSYLRKKGAEEPVYMAPTHKANVVTRKNNPNVIARTIHSFLGLSPTLDLSNPELDYNNEQFNIKNLNISPDSIYESTVFIIDESSMIFDKLVDSLIDAAAMLGSKIIFLGDAAQLSPVKQEAPSKALNVNNSPIQLTKVERTGDNAILKEATRLRDGEDLSYTTELNADGDGVIYAKSSDYSILQFIENTIKDTDYANNPNYLKILSATNNMIPLINNLIRNIRFGEEKAKASRFLPGDVLTAYFNMHHTKNTRKPYSIMNGVDYKVVKAEGNQTYTFTAFGKTLNIPCVTVTLQDTVDSEVTDIYFIDETNPNISNVLNDIIELKDFLYKQTRSHNAAQRTAALKKLDELTEFGMMNAITRNVNGRNTLKIRKTFDYGYAQTVHKSQGSTYDNVVIYGDTFDKFQSENQKQSLKYVSVTRAKHKVLYVTDKHDLTNKADTVNNTTLSDFNKELKDLGTDRIAKCKS